MIRSIPVADNLYAGRLGLLPLNYTYNLDENDHLLTILSDDARAGITEGSKATRLPSYTVRRKISSPEENGFIIGCKVNIQLSRFLLRNTILFDCVAKPDEAETCRRKLIQLPFPGFFLPQQSGLLCQVSLPPEAASSRSKIFGQTLRQGRGVMVRPAYRRECILDVEGLRRFILASRQQLPDRRTARNDQ